MRSKQRIWRNKVFSIAICIIALSLFFFPWIKIEEESLTVFGCLIKANSMGGMMAYFKTIRGYEEAGALFFGFVLKFAGFVVAFYLIYVIRLLRGKESDRYESFICYFSVVWIYFFFWGINYELHAGITPLPVVFVVLIIMEFIGRRMTLANIELDKKKETTKDEMDDKLSIHFNNIIFKSFQYNWKNYVLLVISSTATVITLFLAFAMKDMFGALHTKEEVFGGGGMIAVLSDSLIWTGVLSIFLMIMSFRHYFGSRARDYGIFIIIGMTRRSVWKMILKEYLSCVCLAYFFGLLLGSGMILILRNLFIGQFNKNIRIPFPSIFVYVYAVLLSALIFIVCIGVSRDSLSLKNLTQTVTTSIRDEKISFKHCRSITVFGIILVIGSLVLFANRRFHESTNVLYFLFIGVIIVIHFGGRNLVLRRQKNIKYYQKIFKWNTLEYRYKSNMNYFIMLTVIHFMIAFYLIFPITTLMVGEEEELFPYDAVLIGKENNKELVKEIYSDSMVIPMMRISVPGGDSSYSGGMSIMPQGQHIGISESDYVKLGGKKLNLENEEIAVLYQQQMADTSHPLDFDLVRDTPGIYMGEGHYYDWKDRNEIFHYHPVKSENREIFLGYLNGGIQENVVIFSNTYFNENYKKDVHSSKLYLIRKLGKSQKTKELLKKFKDSQKEAPDSLFDVKILHVYQKEELLWNVRTENQMRMVMHIFIGVLMAFCAFLIIFIKFSMELPDLKQRNQYLKCMGMFHKDRKKIIVHYIWKNVLFSEVVALTLTAVLLGIVFRLRYFKIEELVLVLGKLGILFGIYLGVLVIGTFLIQRKVQKEVGV